MSGIASQTHLADAGAQERPCDNCGTLFKPTRSWSRFCRTKGDDCRNDFHAREARIEAIRARAVQMYEALQLIAGEAACTSVAGFGCHHCVAAAAIKDLKAP